MTTETTVPTTVGIRTEIIQNPNGTYSQRVTLTDVPTVEQLRNLRNQDQADAAVRGLSEEQQEQALLSALEARAEAVLGLPNLEELADLERQAAAIQELTNETERVRQSMYARLQNTRDKLNKKKQEAERKKRWRMYQVWRIIDDDGVTDWTPGNGEIEAYKITHVGQVVDFKQGDRDHTLNMCRGGTHGARFLNAAVNSYIGKRAVRLELEGWISPDHNFRCQTAKVLAIVDLAEMLGKDRVVVPEPTKAEMLRNWFTRGHSWTIGRSSASTRRGDYWRTWLADNEESPLNRLIAAYEADPNYQPDKAIIREMFLCCTQAEVLGQMFGISDYNSPTWGEDQLRAYFDTTFEKMRGFMGQPGRNSRMGNADAVQVEAANMDAKELETRARAYLKEHYPDLEVKDFGVKRGQDSLDPNAQYSPTYWMDR